jgi:two-component system, NarL family, sensor histidine kinase DesK
MAVNENPNRGAKYLPYIWLVYLAALFVQPAFDPSAGVLDWLAVAVLIAVFLPLYRAAVRTSDQHRLMMLIAAFVLLAVTGSLVNTGASIFVVYAAALAGRLQPVRRAVWVIIALAGVTGLIYLISQAPMPWRIMLVAPEFVFTLVVGAASIFDAERARAQRRLRRADEEIERLATIAERERIARDLHDLLGHTLSVIVLKSELAARLITIDSDRAEQEVHDIEHTARTALTEVRAAVTGYRATGLGGELANARRVLAAAGVDTELQTNLPELPAEQESALAFAVRESVTNVLRHAQARHASIRINSTTEDVVVEVSDDGRGGHTPDGAGLTGMRERISALGGGVTRVTGSATDNGSGTLVRVTLPRNGRGTQQPMDTKAAQR